MVGHPKPGPRRKSKHGKHPDHLALIGSLIDEVIGLILDVSHEGLVKAHRKKGRGFVRGYQKCVNDMLDEISRWKSAR